MSNPYWIIIEQEGRKSLDIVNADDKIIAKEDGVFPAVMSFPLDLIVEGRIWPWGYYLWSIGGEENRLRPHAGSKPEGDKRTWTQAPKDRKWKKRGVFDSGVVMPEEDWEIESACLALFDSDEDDHVGPLTLDEFIERLESVGVRNWEKI